MKYWKNLDELFENQKGKCAYSGREMQLGQDAELDHIIPKTRGGKTELNNLQWTIKVVNRLKKNSLEHEFFENLKELIDILQDVLIISKIKY